MRWEQKVQYASLTDIGFRRRNNQDELVVQICTDRATWAQHGHLFMVADGMGGHAVGELASKIAADTLPHTYFKTNGLDVRSALRKSLEVVNATIFERGAQNRDFEQMGTTCSALVLCSRGAVIGHVGDSRVYRIRGERIDQLTFDHSLQWELIRNGAMKAEEVFLHEPRHVITRSLGPDKTVEIDLEGPYGISPGDTYVLCSDGLTGHVRDPEIGAIARALPPGDACRLLVNLANLRGGSDNVTVLVARVGDLPEGLEDDQGPHQPAAEQGASWWWLAGLWGIAILFVAGLWLWLFGRTVAGAVVTALAVIAVVAMLAAWYRRRPLPGVDPKSAETTYWSPYRTATAKLSRKFLNHLAAVEAELQRTATEEGWSIDWPEHELAFQSGKSAIENGQLSRAFGGYAKAIDVLMAGVQQLRRQVSHEKKWGKNSTPPPQGAQS